METNTHNIYLFKALDAYPFELEEAVEALNYALSYDPNSVVALCLMANLHADQLRDFETAKYFFEAAMVSNMEMPGIYPDYIYTLIRNEDYEEAQKLLDFAMTLKATDKAVLEIMQGRILEIAEKYKEAIAAYKRALKKGLNTYFITYVDGELERVKKKLPKKKRKRKKKNKKTKRKEKKKNRSKK